jgi:methylglyoxal synthase
LEPHPHDTDVKALLRIAVVYNLPVACKRASADFMISSPLMSEPYQRLLPDYREIVERKTPA